MTLEKPRTPHPPTHPLSRNSLVIWARRGVSALPVGPLGTLSYLTAALRKSDPSSLAPEVTLSYWEAVSWGVQAP